eukprot:scaffold405611_cov18-Prasinocladus_malaysianus.AAC.1
MSGRLIIENGRLVKQRGVIGPLLCLAQLVTDSIVYSRAARRDCGRLPSMTVSIRLGIDITLDSR